MPAYLYQASYSGETIKALVNNPQDRSGAARAAIEANGGTMIGAWMAFGEDDLIVIADLPDDESMAGVALAIASTGAIVNGKTTKLLTLDQAVSGMKKANAVLNAYKPPVKYRSDTYPRTALPSPPRTPAHSRQAQQ
ncbi:MAG TPA: GYD domain-containing protein [Gammaproteobacteria bacterium]|nr:GYD domain-containing protein [Gammaproteobacteria bacterium]